MLVDDLTSADYATFSNLERIASALSLCGTAFVAFTFLSSEAFQKPINRLVFYACLGNIFSNVATIMARAAIDAVKDKNYHTSLCQFQAVLIQMFLPADALWTFVMALNVFLTFYRSYNAADLRRLEKWYAVFCYGIPFVPAIVFLFVKNSEQGYMYGNATLWCWVDSEWDIFRIATFYGPVWLVILSTIGIYVYAGRDIYQKTKQLRDFRHAVPDPMTVPQDPFTSQPNELVYVTQDTLITSDATAPSDPIDLPQLSPNGRQKSGIPVATSKYNVTITGGSPSSANRNSENTARSPSTEKPPGEERQTTRLTVPATVHMPNSPIRKRAVMEANSAMLSYTKVAVLFFIAMMITWIPSSANRLYSVINTGQVSLALECLSAFVLPLQGFWNALIYATTSLPACRAMWKQLRENKRLSGSGIRNLTHGFTSEADHAPSRTPRIGNNRGTARFHETDSMTELKESRPQSSRDDGQVSEDRIEPAPDYSRTFPSAV
ncbi:hypothetical protein EG329_001395 [Mollisiaceae sp. DMI_Dod_QoI]|nr:hypothetical protein EG329_001395 [Helotiales sp. DMI_Dod_QoI]